MLKISRAALIAAALTAGSFATHSFAQELSLDSPGDAESSAPGVAVGYDFSVVIPTVTSVGSSMDDAALKDALTGAFAKYASQIASLNATSITIPEITFTTTVTTNGESVEQRASYTDIVLNNIRDGIAETATIGAMSQSAGSQAGNVVVTYNASSMKALNLGAILAFLTPVEGASSEMQTIYTDYVFGGGKVTGDNISCTIGTAETGGFRAKPPKISFQQYMDATERMAAAGGNPAQQDVVTTARFVADIFRSFESDPLTFNGLDCSGKDPAGSAFAVSFDKLTMSAWQVAHYPSFSVEGLKVTGDGAKVGLASATFKGMDLTKMLAALDATPDAELTPEWFQSNPRKWIPEWDGLAFSGLDLDVPNPEASNSRVIGGVGEFDLTLGHYTNGIPADISSFAKNVKYTIPTNTVDPQQQMMLALGMTELDLGYNIKLGWDEAAKTVRVDDVSVSGANLGSIAVASTIGNALPQLFDVDPQIEQAAAMSLTLQNLDLNLVDTGLGDIIITVLAGQQGVDPAQMRTALAGQAAGSVLQIFGATPEAQALSEAIGAFVGGQAKSLGIGLVSKDPAGLPLPLLMQGSQDPNVLINQVTVTGSAH